MASTALGKLQGQGLIETTTAGLQQSGAQLAATPMGAALQGRGADSTKMAGTPSAKINALSAGMRDVNSVALAGLRETSRIMEGTAADTARADQARRATPLGRVDDALSKKATEILNENLKALKFEGAELDTDKLTSLGMSTEQLETLDKSVKDLTAGGTDFTQEDIDNINAALIAAGVDKKNQLSWDGETPPSTYAMATAISQLFTKKSSEELQGILSDAILDARNATTINSLDDAAIDAIFDTPATSETKDDLIKLLTDLTGQDATAVAAMKLEDVRAALATWKEKEFKDIAKLRATLQDKDASRAQRQLAVKELRRLGHLGVTSAEQKVGDIEKQMQDGDTIKIGDQEWTYDEIFSDPTKLEQLSTWIDNPEEAPAEIRTWLTENRDALSLKITDLLGDNTKGLAGATERVKQNNQTIQLSPEVKALLSDNTYDAFFPGWNKGSLDPYSIFLGNTAVAEEQKIGDAAVAKAEAALKEGQVLSEEDKAKIRQDALNADPEYVKAQKYKLLQDGTYGKNTALLLTGLTGLGQEGKDIFKELTIKEIKELSLSDAGVNRFLAGITNRRNAAAFSGTTNLKQEFKDTMATLGLGSTAALFANLEGADMAEFADIFKEAGLSGYLEGNKFALSKLTDQIKAIGKMSVSDLVKGTNRSIIDNLRLLHTKLTNEFGRVGMREEKILKESERDAAFLKSGKAGAYAKTSKQKLDELVAEKDRIGGVNHQNMLNRNAARDSFNKEVPGLLKVMGLSPYATTITAPERGQFQRGPMGDMDYNGAVAAYNKYLRLRGDYNAAEAVFRRSSTDFDNANNNISSFENTRPQYDAERNNRFTSWWKDYESGLAGRNEALRKRYVKLQSLFTTGAAA